jgi:hypothetical protein
MSEEEIIDGIRNPGRFDADAESLEEAERLVRRALPHAIEVEPAQAGQPYPSPPSGVDAWFQRHPPEPNVGQPKPHLKYADWTGGKKERGGSWGHVFFPPGAAGES